jgi:hypothetical protein
MPSNIRIELRGQERLAATGTQVAPLNATLGAETPEALAYSYLDFACGYCWERHGSERTARRLKSMIGGELLRRGINRLKVTTHGGDPHIVEVFGALPQ